MKPTSVKPEMLFYVGDKIHQKKIKKVEMAMKKHGIDAILVFLPDAVRYLTDFYVTGYRPFWEWSYLSVFIPGNEPVLGYGSGSDSWRITYHCLKQ